MDALANNCATAFCNPVKPTMTFAVGMPASLVAAVSSLALLITAVVMSIPEISIRSNGATVSEEFLLHLFEGGDDLGFAQTRSIHGQYLLSLYVIQFVYLPCWLSLLGELSIWRAAS